jgi:hypothetical protein
MRARELVARGGFLAAGVGAFAYTAMHPVTGLQGAAGGAALILGLYLGFTPWAALKRLMRRQPHGGRP